MKRTAVQYGLLGLMLAIFGVCLLWPIYQVLRVGFTGVDGGGFTLSYLGAVFQDPVLRRGLINSAWIAVCVTLLCMLMAVPLAVLSVRYDFTGKKLMGGLLLVPLILPPFVGAIGMRQIMGRMGALSSLAGHLGWVEPGTPVDWLGTAPLVGVVLVEALSLYPIIYLNVAAALANLDPAMEQAAANLGAPRATIFRRITLPLMRPGLLAGGTIVLIWSFTELGTPLMFDFTEVTAVQIFQRITQVSISPLPYALVVVMLLVSILLYVLGRLVLGRRHDTAVTKASTPAAPRQLRGWRALAALAPFVLVSGLALLPHLGVVLTSFSSPLRWYQSVLPSVWTGANYAAALTHDLALPSVANSMTFAAISMVIDLALGLLIAWLVVRSSVRGRALLDALAMVPLAVPGLVLAFGYLAISVKLDLWFKDVPSVRPWVNVQQNPMLLLVIAYAMRRLPYVVRSAVAGLQQTPVDLEMAARNLGASGWRTLRRITVPLIAANLIAGGLLAFAFAMLEVSDSLILAQKQAWWPMTKAIYELFQRLMDGPYIAAALGVWAMAVLTLTLLAANALLGRRLGAVFRV